jgi:DNA-binding CsgD family transcriptional regulator
MAAPDHALTDRELDALRQLAGGHTSKEIALILGVTKTAVDHAIERATHRLGASHRAHAVAVAMRRGLLT